MDPLPLGEIGVTPWSLSPLWFCVIALLVPAAVWLTLAWRRALLECPNRVRRAGVKELRRLLKSVQRSDQSPQPAHLHAWLRATARVWNVRTSAPCVSEVAEAAHALTGDPTVSSRWRNLWQTTEHGLYAPDARPARDWFAQAFNAAATVDMPKRERLFPNRLGLWLPSVGLAMFIFTMGVAPETDADVPWSAQPTTEEPAAVAPDQEPAAVEDSTAITSPEQAAPQVLLTAEDGQAAQAALKANWNDWAAHRNLAAFLSQQGELNRAIAHATAAFVQHPAAASTRDTLLAAFGETPSVDPNLRRLLSGSWYQRVPALLSPAGWQRLALAACLIVAMALSAMILAWYAPTSTRFELPAYWSWAGRGSVAVGALLMVVAISSWNAYGALSQPSAAILLQGANSSPVPTDLVPVEETSPLAAGAVVLTKRTFLGWREVSSGPDRGGWVRSNVLMPLYASH
ncbi:MAG: hypothetical protein SXG53_18940 [Pseudomonadota bacterium]|nr:hypothetical protein [Pseudomonadota bacterium]